MSIFDPATAVLRSVLGVAERDSQRAVEHSPLHEAATIEAHLAEIATAVHRAAASAESHADVLDGLASSIPALTEAVTLLTTRIDGLLQVLAPLGAIERDASRLEHLFGRRRPRDTPTPGA